MRERAVGVEDLDAVVAAVGHGDHAWQPFKLHRGTDGRGRWQGCRDNGDGWRRTVSHIIFLNGKHKRAVGVEDLDALVVAVGHHDVAVEGDSHARRVGEDHIDVKGVRERAVGVEDLDALVVAIQYHNLPVGANGHVR